MSGQTMSILEGNTFVVSDRRGDVDSSPADPHGLFDNDTRFLSRWVLTLDGKRPTTLSVDAVEYYLARFFLAQTSGTTYIDAKVSVMRTRAVSHGFHEQIRVMNHGPEPVTLELRLEVDADFADLFEVKDALKKRGKTYRGVKDGVLVLGYQREKWVRETRISATNGAIPDSKGLTFHLRIAPHGQWTTDIDVRAVPLVRGRIPSVAVASRAGDGTRRHEVANIVATRPRMETDWLPLVRTYERSLVDLAALRFYPLLTPGESLPAAGLPWFMAVFGRDSLITSFQALPFEPELARTTLRVLGARQGTRVDLFRDEEPGKILHEARAGELTAFCERPHSPYFGSADSTPLFLILLDEYEQWSGDADVVRALEREARAALTWIDTYGDRNGDGYVSYKRGNDETGLENQCWKDSWSSIVFADGSMSRLPRATCEIQGYVYDAKMRCARLARAFWNDAELAARLEHEAGELKRRFNHDFWMPERRCFALALDGDGRQVDAITSNIGHLLWSGIVDDDKAEAVVTHLMGNKLFSGWGVRTMAEGEGAYNPLGYHLGTVWPHDNSIIAMGLSRYGYRDASSRIAAGILEAACYFDHRLPEAFAGYPREETTYPVEYPTACSPQAWATGAPLLFLRTMLGMQPRGNRLVVDAALPSRIERLALRDLPGRWGRADAEGHRETARVVTRAHGT